LRANLENHWRVAVRRAVPSTGKLNETRTTRWTLSLRLGNVSAMGQRHPDRISIVERRPGCETVEAMTARRWLVQARCPSCRLTLDVDLFLVGSVKGPRTRLWDRDAKCRRHGCKGRMVFEAKAPGMVTFERLAGHPVKREPAWKRGREGA
jgi:hypothetical protein